MSFTKVASIAGIAAAVSFASGINTNTNQSASYLRNVARFATTENDAPYYNPAGTALMTDGLHLSINTQSFWQSRTTYAESPLFNGEKRFRGEASIPSMPSILATWHHGNLAISGMFGIVGGGGKLENAHGVPSFEAAVAQIPGLLTLNGLETSSYQADISLDGTSYVFGAGLGVSYRIMNMIGVYAGARFNYQYNHYKGYLKDVKVNPVNEQLGLTGEMVTLNEVAETLTATAEKAAAGAEQASGAAKQYAAAGDEASAAKYTAMATQYKATAEQLAASAKKMEASASLASDKDLDVEQTGWGITPIAGLAFNYKRLAIGVRFEYNTSIELENDTKVNEVGIESYNDGVKDHNDIPASLYAGIAYSVLDNARLCVAFGHWFDSKANLPGDMEDHVDGTNEFLYGVEVDFFKRWTISGGVQITRYNVDKDYISDTNILLDNTTFGFGAAWRATDWLKLNLAYFHSLYNDRGETVSYGYDRYTRTSRGIGLGADLDF